MRWCSSRLWIAGQRQPSASPKPEKSHGLAVVAARVAGGHAAYPGQHRIVLETTARQWANGGLLRGFLAVFFVAGMPALMSIRSPDTGS